MLIVGLLQINTISRYFEKENGSIVVGDVNMVYAISKLVFVVGDEEFFEGK